MAYRRALGTPIIVLAGCDRLRPADRSARWSGGSCRSSRCIVPFWLIWTFCGLRRTVEIWPAILVAGLSFAIPQFMISNYHGPWLVDMLVGDDLDGAAWRCSCKVWKPKTGDAGSRPRKGAR